MKTACLLISTMALLPSLPAAAAEKALPAPPPAEAFAKTPPDTSAKPPAEASAKAAANAQTPAIGSLKDALPGKKSGKPSSKKKTIQLNLCDQ